MDDLIESLVDSVQKRNEGDFVFLAERVIKMVACEIMIFEASTQSGFKKESPEWFRYEHAEGLVDSRYSRKRSESGDFGM